MYFDEDYSEERVRRADNVRLAQAGVSDPEMLVIWADECGALGRIAGYGKELTCEALMAEVDAISDFVEDTIELRPSRGAVFWALDSRPDAVNYRSCDGRTWHHQVRRLRNQSPELLSQLVGARE